MSSTQPQRVYEDFEPTIEWLREANTDTLIVYLPGFAKEELKVQVTSIGKLRISGERRVSGDKWSRFRSEFQIDSNYDVNGISAKFERGILFIKHPKIIVPATEEPQQQPQTQVQQPQKPTTPKPDGEKQKVPESSIDQEKPKEPKPEPPKTVDKPPKEEAKQPPISQELQEKPFAEAAKPEKQPTTSPDRRKAETSTEYAPQKPLEEKMKSETDEQEKDGFVEAKGAGREEIKIAITNYASRMSEYIQGFGAWVQQMMKKPVFLVNFVVVIVVLILAIYAKSALRSVKKNE